jgi:hypothetical protein
MSIGKAVVKDVLRSINGPIILVGHSYGGLVISNAASAIPTSRPWSTWPPGSRTREKFWGSPAQIPVEQSHVGAADDRGPDRRPTGRRATAST